MMMMIIHQGPAELLIVLGGGCFAFIMIKEMIFIMAEEKKSKLEIAKRKKHMLYLKQKAKREQDRIDSLLGLADSKAALVILETFAKKRKAKEANNHIFKLASSLTSELTRGSWTDSIVEVMATPPPPSPVALSLSRTYDQVMEQRRAREETQPTPTINPLTGERIRALRAAAPARRRRS